jgi:small-conductance mechanosensitive channel
METAPIRAARPQLVRAAVAAIVAVAGMVGASTLGDLKETGLSGPFWKDMSGADIAGLCAVGLFLVAGIVAVRSTAAGVRRALEVRLGDPRGAPLALIVSIIGYLLVLLATLQFLGVETGSLLLGGAITGIVLGIAAQQTLGNFFAGIVLLVVRPFNVGEHIVLRSGPLGGEYEGRVVGMGIFYLDLVTENGPVALPNAGVLAAAIGPGARAPKDEGQVEEEEQPAPASQGGPPGSPRAP